jgi:DNA-binding IclR family transcriptional regulator
MTEHRVPSIDRAVEILEVLTGPEPLLIREVCERSAQARSTVYRTLNTLEAHGLVRRATPDRYVLGPTLLRLARAVPQGVDLVAISRPVLDRLAAELGTSAKLSILDGEEALVVAVAEAPGAYSITTQVGRRFPLHAGAASKLLLAHLTPERRMSVLKETLPALTPNTITDPVMLEAAVENIRSVGFAEDHGEYLDGVKAVAAPIVDALGDCLGAISAPYIGDADMDRSDRIKKAIIAGGKTISALVGGNQAK